MGKMIWIVSAAAYGFLVLADAGLFGFLSAFGRANYMEIAEGAEKGEKLAQRLDRWHENEMEFVQRIHIVCFSINVMIGFIIVNFGWNYIESKFVYKFAAVILGGIIAAIAGIAVPSKAVGYHPDKWAYRLSGMVKVFLYLFAPLIWVVSVLSDAILLLLGKNPDEEMDAVTEDEIITIVNEGQEQGIIEDNEAEMITKIIEFGDKQASDIMVHRTSINAIDGDTTVMEAYQYILESNNSRYPVYQNDINNIIGILHLKDIVRANNDARKRRKKVSEVKDLLYEPEFIPETRNLNDLFKMMQKDKIHMAIVVDEYGQTSGIVTMEDIIEEIMGNIQDEHDDEEELIFRREDDTYVVDGMSLLEDVGEELSIDFESQYNTINGFMTDRLGKIPNPDNVGFTVEYCGYIFKAIEVGNRVFETISITKADE